MKTIKYFAAVIAICALAVGCNKEQANVLSELQPSKSYVTIPADGGSVSIEINATEAWTFDVLVAQDSTRLDDVKGKVKVNYEKSQLEIDDNKWVTISPLNGNAGKTTVTFTAPKSEESNTTEFLVNVGDKQQHIIVAQTVGAKEYPISTVEEVNEGPETTYRVQGTCTSISSTVYGNWYLKDAAGKTLYIYGTVDASGSYNWSDLNIAVGDLVTVQGPKQVYNGTVELVDVSVIEVKKALILSDDGNKTITKGTDPFTITLTNKGEKLTYSTENDWLSIEGGFATDDKGNLVFTVYPAANGTGALREGTVTFIATKGSGDKMESTEFPVAVKQLGTDALTEGGIKKISEICATTSSSKTPAFYDVMIDKAKVTFKNGSNIFIEDATGGLVIYNADCTLAVGDVVTGRVYGEGYAYQTLPEATQFNYELAKVESGKAPKPTEATIEQILNGGNAYVSRYVVIKDATVPEGIDVTYSKITKAGNIQQGDKSLPLQIQSSGKWNGNKIYFYSNHPENSRVEVTAVLGVYKGNLQLNIYDGSQIKDIN